MEKINKYDPFSDEVEYSFYTHPLNIKDKVSEDVLDKIINRNKEENIPITKDTEDILDASGIKIHYISLFSREKKKV
jgi:hypothetical protein